MQRRRSAATVAGKEYVVLISDMFGAGYGYKPKTREEWVAGVLYVRDAKRHHRVESAPASEPHRDSGTSVRSNSLRWVSTRLASVTSTDSTIAIWARWKRRLRNKRGWQATVSRSRTSR
jgi:hypothetical protein